MKPTSATTARASQRAQASKARNAGAAETTLIAVAHGSRDPRSAAAIHELMTAVRGLRPELDVRVAFLELSAPRLPDVLAAVHAEGGRRAVVTPLLLGSAYHARVDIPRVVTQATSRYPMLDVRVSEVLGGDSRLEGVALDRLAQAGADPADDQLGVVLAGAGSSHEHANAAVAAIARGWTACTRWRTTAAFASAEPEAAAAVLRLRAEGCRRIAVGSWFLAPGRLPDSARKAVVELEPEALIAAPLGADERVAALVLDRYDAAVTAARRRADLRSA